MPGGQLRDRARQRWFASLALSALLHGLALFLAATALRPAVRAPAPAAGSLIARLLPPLPAPRLEAPAPPARRRLTGAPMTAPSAPVRNAPQTPPLEPAAAAAALPPPRPGPTIDLGAALATARRHARQFAPPKSLQPGPAPVTVESAIARAAQDDATLELRGAAGEHVLIKGRTRCVTPLAAPHFMEGTTMLSQCEVRKG